MNQQSFALNKAKRNVRNMRETPIVTTVEGDVSDLCLNLSLESISQRAHLFVAIFDFILSEFRGHAEGDDVRDGFCSGASLTFLMATDLLRNHAHAAANEQRADTLRRIDLVPG